MSPAITDICAAFHSGQLDHVIRLAEASLAAGRADGRTWELLGIAYHHRGHFNLAVDALERASLLVPLGSAARISLARCYAHVGRLSLSRDVLRYILEDESLSTEALLAVAASLDAVDQPCLAMKACRRAAACDPDASQAYYDMGYYAARCGYPSGVSEALARRAISLDPACVNFRVGLASLLMQQSRRQEAWELVQHFTPADVATIRCRSCVRRLGDLYEEFGDCQRKQSCQKQHDALEINPTIADCD